MAYDDLKAGLGLVRRAGAGRGAGRHAFTARPSGERNQRHVAFAGRDCFSRMRGERHIRRTAELGRLGMADFQVHVFDHRRRPGAGRIAGAEITVNVLERQSGILDRSDRHLGVKLRHGLVRRVPRRVLEGAGDIGLTLYAHAGNSPLFCGRNLIGLRSGLQHPLLHVSGFRTAWLLR